LPLSGPRKSALPEFLRKTRASGRGDSFLFCAQLLSEVAPGVGGNNFRGLEENLTGGIMKLDTLKKLFVEELRDLYSAETQLLKALPKMAKGASSEELKQAFEDHLSQTQDHVDRLEEIFKGLVESPKGNTCHGMKGLVEEGSKILNKPGEASVLDAGIIAAAQKIEHYEIASYGTVRTFAQLLGEDEAAELLQQTLDEEGDADKHLNELAEEIVNPEALVEDEEERALISSNRRY
jgi:ferritin-like metal-binding protein YciE